MKSTPPPTKLRRLLGSRSRLARLVWGGLVIVVVAALRFPWLEADGGNPGFASYGVFTTDEGYNTSGGRLAYLTGDFLDPALLEPLAFTASWGMAILNYLGYLFGGLTFGAARLPTMLAAVAGWWLAYRLATRHTLPWLAGCLTLLLSCNPLSLTYERIHSTDIVVGCLVVLTYVLFSHRDVRRAALAGVVLGFALSVKTTTLGFVPLFVFSALADRRPVLRRLIALGLTFGLSFGVLWWWRQTTIAAAGGLTSDLMVRTLVPVSVIITFNSGEWFRALSIFPRWPQSCQMGPFALWLLLLPVWCVLTAWYRTQCLLTRRSAVFLGLLLYLGMWSIQPQSPLRRLVPPVLYFLPLLLIWGRSALARQSWRHLPAKVGLATLLLLGVYWWPRDLLPAALAPHRYHEYIVPLQVAWTLNWPIWLAGGIGLLVALRAAAPRQMGWRLWVTVGTAGFCVLWLFSANYVLVLMGLRGAFLADQLVLQLGAMALLTVLLLGQNWRPWRRWYGFCLVMFLLFAGVDSHWREAYADQVQWHYVERDAARQLARVLPANSIVVGRRSTQLLRGTAMRLGLVLPIWEPAKYFADIERLLRQYPDRPLYLLLDSDQTAPGVAAFLRERSDRFSAEVVATLQQYADSDPRLVPLYVLRIRLR